MLIIEYLQNGHWLAALSIMGFSFFAGWAMGFALKVVFKVVLVMSGLVLIAIITLQYSGVIPDVDWGRVEQLFRQGAAGIKSEGTDLFHYALAQLPTATAVGAGFYFGFNRLR